MLLLRITESILNKTIGTNIKKYRIENSSLNQEELAKRVGVSRSTIACLESNNINKGISLYTLYKIAKELGKDIGDFFV